MFRPIAAALIASLAICGMAVAVVAEDAPRVMRGDGPREQPRAPDDRRGPDDFRRPPDDRGRSSDDARRGPDDRPRPEEGGGGDDHPRPGPRESEDARDIDRARAAARASETPGDDLDRARAAARAASPWFQGLERSRALARGGDPTGGTDCLSGRDARRAIIAKRAVPLSQAVRSAREAWSGEVIDYRLCTYAGSLAYELTLLNADGKVARVRVDAADGHLLGVR
ncbi:PepSY domain-containing protein [Hansschlegelia beijingensis]|uniref:Putative membrane protein YkoI n=1 Tax=Hansschlegelia beijingensis TaxID=1133344 RepID=A0A7W6CVM3_9HYPH|nr:hypothetical protein [Hansschlegelia beijingensis]MBB3971950.1 putative membrane protein YkoI [Hansschlegelia beijingensis]